MHTTIDTSLEVAGSAGILAGVRVMCVWIGSRGRRAQEERPATPRPLVRGAGYRAE